MSEEQQKEILTTYQKLKQQNDELTAKVNSLTEMLENEKKERERIDLIAKINTVLPGFQATDKMDATALLWILEGIKLVPKANASPNPSAPGPSVNPTGGSTANKANPHLGTDHNPKLVIGKLDKAVFMGEKEELVNSE